jgi:hypothetical protein
MWLERLGQLKNTITSLGIKPTTFQLSAQCLKQLRHRVSLHRDHTVTNGVLLIIQLCFAEGNLKKP